MENPSLNNSIDKKQRRRTTPTQCKICGGPAIYSYFGVVSCESCKIFFRRKNAQKGKVN
jgi:hypothetical protein